MMDGGLMDADFDFDLYDGARIVIIVLAIACIAMTIAINWRRFHAGRMTFGYANIRLGVVGVLAAVAYSTFEVFAGWHSQTRVWVLLGALTWLTVGLIWSIQDGRRK